MNLKLDQQTYRHIQNRMFMQNKNGIRSRRGCAETEYDEEPGKSGDSSSDSEGQQSQLKSSKAEGLTGEAMEEDSASDADDQQTPPSVTAKGQARAAKARGPNSTRQWKEYNLLSHSDNTNAEIMAFVRADLADLNKKAGIISLLVTTIARQATYTATGCAATVGAPTLATYKIPGSYVPLLTCGCSCEAKIEETPVTRNILLLRTKTTVPDSFPSTCKTLFARP